MARLIRQMFRIPSKAVTMTSSIRQVSTAKNLCSKNYEGDGKTTVNFLNRDNKHLIIFDSISDHGFRLSNGIFAVGPIAAFPRTILQWNVKTAEDITEESLSLFTLMEPRLDVFVLGLGSKGQRINPTIVKYLRSHGISIEILHTEQACATFNFLNFEGRFVAGAFIPPTDIPMFEEDVVLLDSEKHGSGPYIM